MSTPTLMGPCAPPSELTSSLADSNDSCIAPLVPLAPGALAFCGHPGCVARAGEFAVWTGAGYLPICDAACLPVALAWIVEAVS